MIRLAHVIASFEAGFLAQYRDKLMSNHYRALAAMQHCRTCASHWMQVQCTGCVLSGRLIHPCKHTNA